MDAQITPKNPVTIDNPIVFHVKPYLSNVEIASSLCKHYPNKIKHKNMNFCMPRLTTLNNNRRLNKKLRIKVCTVLLDSGL